MIAFKEEISRMNARLKKKIMDIYNAEAMRYDYTRAFYEKGYGGEREKEILISHCIGTLILDLACGTGRLLGPFISRRSEVVGIDLSRSMLLIAKMKVPEAHLILGDVENLPFREFMFNCIVCSRALRYFESLEQALREAYRCLRKGGKIALSFESQDPLWVRLFCRLGVLDPFHFRYRIKEIRHLLFEQGFNVIHEGCIFYFGVAIYERMPKFLVRFLKLFDRSARYGRNEIIIGMKLPRI